MNAPLPESVRRALAEVSLDDRWTLDQGRAYMNGTQALLRLAMLQRQRDQMAGLNTAGFITGYRGSPLGAVDQTAWRAKKHLEKHHVRFHAGPQRGPRGHQRVGHAAGQHVRRRQVRRRLLHVVRQGSRRGSLRRRVQARQRRRHQPARRRARAGRRRPQRQELDAAAPVGPHLQGLHDAGAVPGNRAGIPRRRPARLRDEPVFGRVGRRQDGDRGRRGLGLGDRRSRARDHPAADGFRRSRRAA